MEQYFKKMAIFATATIGLAGIAQAAPITYNFTAINFQSAQGTPAPNNTVTGSYTFDGTTVSQFDMTIGSHHYSVDEVAYYSDYTLIGGKLSDTTITWGTNDFWLQWYVDGSIIFSNFFYTTEGIIDSFQSHTGTISVATPAAVPVPAAAWLFGSGLLGLAGATRRRPLTLLEHTSQKS